MNTQAEQLLVNVGAGLSCGKSWLNFDFSPTLRISKIPVLGPILNKIFRFPPWPGATRYGDIVKGLPIPHGSCRLIFCSHVFDHLSLCDLEKALSNVYAHLQPGGIFRVIVPDLEAYARNYLKQLEDERTRPTASVDFLKTALLGCETTRTTFRSRLAESLGNSRHQWLWDRYSLAKKLEEHKFTGIKLCRYGEWSDPRFAEIEDHARHHDAICFECRK